MSSRVTNIKEAIYIIPYAVAEQIRDTSTHSYYGAGLSVPADVSRFRLLRIEVTNLLNAALTITIQGRGSTDYNSSYHQVGDPIHVATGPVREYRTIDLDEHYFEELRIDVLAATTPSANSTTIIVSGVWR